MKIQIRELVDVLTGTIEDIRRFQGRKRGVSPQQYAQLKEIEREYDHIRMDWGRYTLTNHRPYGMVVQ